MRGCIEGRHCGSGTWGAGMRGRVCACRAAWRAHAGCRAARAGHAGWRVRDARAGTARARQRTQDRVLRAGRTGPHAPVRTLRATLRNAAIRPAQLVTQAKTLRFAACPRARRRARAHQLASWRLGAGRARPRAFWRFEAARVQPRRGSRVGCSDAARHACWYLGPARPRRTRGSRRLVLLNPAPARLSAPRGRSAAAPAAYRRREAARPHPGAQIRASKRSDSARGIHSTNGNATK